MARTIIGVNDAKAVKRWAGLLALDTSQKSYFNQRFMGRGAEAEVPIQILTDLESDAGEQITYDLLAELKMAPVEGEDTLEGKEESQKFYTDAIYIDQARCGVNTGGRMTRKRTLHNLRARAIQQQSDWWARLFDELLFIYLSGARGINDSFIVGKNFAGRAGNPLVPPDADHRIFPQQSAGGYAGLDSFDRFQLSQIDIACVHAETQGGGATGIPVLQPCKIDGAEHFVCVLHPFQEHLLRHWWNTGEWLDLQKAAAGAEGRNSPIFNNSLGMYRGCILHSHNNVIRFNDAGAGANLPAARALFMGAQAGVVAFGTPGSNLRFGWHEETRDNGDKVVISTSTIFGTKKNSFTTSRGRQDFGVLALDSYAEEPR